MNGILYGIGVGPGDPELMTVKAWRLVASAQAIAYLCANGGESTALGIARPFLPEKYEAIAIDMPMRAERDAALAAYDKGAARISAALAGGRDVIFLCEGDPFFYGSFMYLYDRLANSHQVSVVPGVTSITAAAAELGQPLARRDQVFKVLPATMAEDALAQELGRVSSAAIIKVGRHFGKVRRVILNSGLSGMVIEHATRSNQIIRALKDIEGDALPYFSTIIVRRP